MVTETLHSNKTVTKTPLPTSQGSTYHRGLWLLQEVLCHCSTPYFPAQRCFLQFLFQSTLQRDSTARSPLHKYEFLFTCACLPDHTKITHTFSFNRSRREQVLFLLETTWPTTCPSFPRVWERAIHFSPQRSQSVWGLCRFPT